MAIKLGTSFQKLSFKVCKSFVTLTPYRPISGGLCQPKYISKSLVSWTSNNTQDIPSLLKQHTEISVDHLTPEIQLHLLTPNCPLWHCKGDNSPFLDPFWAFYWPGGQALSRFILDNGGEFKGNKILDIGSGCGATAIACKMVGADIVTANDIDTAAAEAIKINAALNGVTLSVATGNMIGKSINRYYDIILLGDMFYDEQFAESISHWLKKHGHDTTTVLIGDPGRHTFKNHSMRDNLTRLAFYELLITCQSENNGLTTGSVWQLKLS